MIFYMRCLYCFAIFWCNLIYRFERVSQVHRIDRRVVEHIFVPHLELLFPFRNKIVLSNFDAPIAKGNSCCSKLP